LDIPWKRVDARRSRILLTIEEKMMAMELSMTLVGEVKMMNGVEWRQPLLKK
jgi:hypothetical protein